MGKIRVLIVDDSALMRVQIRKMLESDPEIEVVGTATNGEDALKKARELSPDVITLDVNMPKMDGITALKRIVEEELGVVIMVSSLTQENAAITFEALEAGAFDYVPKPGGTVSLNIREIQNELIKKVKTAARSRGLKHRLKKPSLKVARSKRSDIPSPEKINKVAVCIGISTGGPKTILDVIPHLPADLPATVYLVQHMPPAFTASFAERLNKLSKIEVIEARPGLKAYNGLVVLGKGGFHLTVYGRSDGNVIVRTPKIPKHLFMPSVDVMMRSVLSVYGKNIVGVLMTGMGDDGADAMVEIRNSGGVTIAESEETAIVFGMPRAAIERGGADYVLPSYEIADKITELVYKRL